ncbi:tumor necrosis factor receptor superfamily member wengen [Maniola hyperantus]|uniref:tumor necrosis factor receptor superfamily member wengen n=1 Tax=Aphantopus hyperantus TaxID=2795564 RepID=UPI001568FAC5|nr:tumor necrosis factor receptor superfamily member wengen isoform X1 [Maniola hyperantus]
MVLSTKVMQGEIAKLCLVIATLALGPAAGEGACERGHTWWHRQRGACVPCTRCDPHRFVVKFPCELHRDTICQPLREVRIWPFNTEKDNDTSEAASDYEYYEYTDYSGEVKEELEWDVQTSTLTVAVSGCVVFFVVVLTLTLYHAKQWRTLKLALKSDVQDLSAKLKLMEAGAETPAEPVPTEHHIYCNIHVGKDALLGPAAGKGLGNVYTTHES